ncbi:MAG: hypothetical protein AAF492_26395, partial [Verrucomicrobiota bacterium]
MTDTCSTITFISDVMPTGFDPTNAVPATIEFGAAVAIDGTIMAAGAPADGGTGAVYVYMKQNGSWDFHHRITPPAIASNGARFGEAIDVTGGHIVIGAPDDDNNAGGVYVFALSASGTWNSVGARISSPNTSSNFHFGSTVSIEQNSNDIRVAIGEPGYGTGTNEQLGAVHTFTHSPTSTAWYAEQTLLSTNPFQQFGRRVDLHHETLAVSAGGEDAVWIYDRSGNSWTEQQKLDGLDKLVYHDEDSTTFSSKLPIALSADLLVIGVPGADVESVSDYGAALIYERENTSWARTVEVLPDIPPSLTLELAFGYHVAASSNRVMVASYDCAQVYVVERHEGTWQTPRKLQGDFSGSDQNPSIALSEEVAV